ncbi:MAG: heme exporter protein CcmD [Pseudomonadota bacterium]
MMPELGKYAGAVLGSYAASVALIAALVAVSLWQGARIKRALAQVEARQGAGAQSGKDNG